MKTRREVLASMSAAGALAASGCKANMAIASFANPFAACRWVFIPASWSKTERTCSS